PDADSLGMYGRAFDVNGTLADNLDEITKEIFIHNNIIVGALIGFRTKSGYDPTSETYNKVHNNTFINCKRVVELISPNHDDTTTCGNGVDFRGNIVENSTVDNIYSDNHSDSYLFIICDNNIWHSSSTPVWTLDGVECDDYADWKSDFNSFFGYDADANSLTGDPLLVGAGTYDEDTDVKFPTNSPAKDNGADLTPTDYFGTSRPQGEGDDIGAFELPVEGSPEDTYTIGVSLTGTGCR
ncbi:MAG: choice-of-anchor Q domain-containing protein, partial [Gammaproteobacteria bacterium]